MTDSTNLSFNEIISNIKDKKISSLEVTESHLKRIKANQDLNAFNLVDEENALNKAKLSDQKIAKGDTASILGAPVAIKDMILTKGVRTTASSNILKDYIPVYDATVVAKINAAGGINLGKTNLDEFAMGSSNENSCFGSVKNPWNKTKVPGGSSGGSAAAVAACLTPVALGTDTGGSIRQPASYCGIVGLKPTYGRVSRYGVIAFASSLDQVGVFARSVKDAALFLEIIAGHDPFDSTSSNQEVPEFSKKLTGDIKGLRIGIPKEYFIKGLNSEVEASVKTAIKKLEELGASIVEISLPHTEYALSVYYVLAPAEASSNLARYDGIRYGHRSKDCKELNDLYSNTRTEGFGSEVRRRIIIGNYVLSSGYYDAYYLKAQQVRSLVAKDFRNAFSTECDVIACPTAPTTAFSIGEKASDPVEMYLNDIFTIPVNLAGLPGMSLPCGFDSKNLPIGLQLIGDVWQEEKILNVGLAYEQATEWKTMRPEHDILKD